MDSRPQISHPYPPSYHSSPQQLQQHQPYTDPYMPSQPQFKYQQRRDERHAALGIDESQDDSRAALAGSPYADMSRGPSPGLAMQQPLYSQESHIPSGIRPPVHRMGSASSSYPLAEEGGVERASHQDGDYPEGWTKEDEEAEKEFLSKGMIDWNVMKKWRFWIRKEWWFYYILIVVGGALVILISLYHDDIVTWLTPVTNWMKDLTAGWTIPIAVLFVLSFPPLFGHEIVALLVGVVWGLWEGFGIVAAGTLLGEIGNFYAFKYCLRSHAAKYEKNNINYACMAHVVREGGFFIIFVVRLSAIPGHFTTAVFATCGMNIWIFTLAAVLTLPKQLIVVYLGVIFAEADDTSTKEKWISHSVLIFGCLVTLWSAWYIWRRMHLARPQVWRRRRIEAAAKGLVLDPKTGLATPSTNAGLKEWENVVPPIGKGEGDDESRSPILGDHQRREREGYGMKQIGIEQYSKNGRTQSYQNPYDIRYQRTDQMSVYDVDGPTMRERDIAYGYTSAQPSSSSHLNPHSDQTPPRRPSRADDDMYFPEAHSTGVEDMGAGPSVHRSGTNATVYAKEEAPVGFPLPKPAVL